MSLVFFWGGSEVVATSVVWVVVRVVESPSEAAAGGSGEAVRLREGGVVGAGAKAVRAWTTSAMF